MDENLRQILTRHWHLAVRYLHPSDDFINTLLAEKVLPSSMVEDIKKGHNRQEKNERLLKSLKLRGNASYRKFLDTLMKFEQFFLADLLREEAADPEPPALIDETDLATFPSIKLSLSSSEQKQLVSVLDSKIRARLLQMDWRRDSSKRLEILKSRTEEMRVEREATMDDYKEQIRNLKSEIRAKNDTLSKLVVEMNSLNDDITTFLRRHQTGENVHVTSLMPTCLLSGLPMVQKSRFHHFDTTIDSLSRQLKFLTGHDVSSEVVKEGTGAQPGHDLSTLDTLVNAVTSVKDMVRDLESCIYKHTQDQETILGLLGQTRCGEEMSFVQGVQKYLAQEQKNRLSLLTDIDQLSRRMRGLNNGDSRSALKALRQSAVIGKPSPEMVDFRFLANHVALLTADAEHTNKKLRWKDAEIHSLATELKAAKARLGMACKKAREVTYCDDWSLK